jgi:peptidoglycan-associated lipoprotein
MKIFNELELSRRARAGFLTLALLCAACPKKTADLELEAARKAMDDARAKRANDCAKETFRAAEDAIAEARALSEKGEVEAAKKRAGEAKQLADRAAAASKPDCEDANPKEPEKKAVEAAGVISPPPPPDFTLEPIYFDYNEASIREDSKAVLDKVAELLRADRKQRMEVEGHCDVRGATEYNLSLGERRAQAVLKYLVKQGVNEDQLDTISYGEERPVDLGGSDDAHAQNRRAELKKL